MARICNNGMTFCSAVGSGTSSLPLPVIPGPKGGKAPPPDPPPAWEASRAANGLSMGGSDGSTGIEGSPIGEDTGKGEDAFIRACMNWCRCSGNQEEGSGEVSLSPSKISAFREGVVLFRLGEGLGDGETLLRFGVDILSSPRKLRLGVILGRGGSTDTLEVGWLYIVRFIYLFTYHREDRLERLRRVLKL